MATGNVNCYIREGVCLKYPGQPTKMATSAGAECFSGISIGNCMNARANKDLHFV